MYTLETLAWDHKGRRELSRGPVAQIQVVEGPCFYGEVQMTPRVTLRVVER